MRKYLTLRHGLLPLVLVCVTATGVRFMGPQSFWLALRWITVSVLGFYVIKNWNHLRGGNSILITIVLVVIAWTTITISWSDAMRLTAMKVCALAVVTFAMFYGGYLWYAMHAPEKFLDYLWPMTVITMVAAASGSGEQYADMLLYSGSVANPNTLGFMVGASFPLLLWAYFRRSFERRSKMWPSLLLLAFFAVLLLTGSRSSYVIVACIVTGYLLALGAARTIVVVYLFGFVLLVLVAVSPDILGAIVDRKFYKGSSDRNVFSTREEVWRDSFEGAQAGGWKGLGYGVSVGHQFQSSSGGFTAMGYGREKGSSQLAIVEETGVIGLTLYVLTLVAIFGSLIPCYFRTVRGPKRVMLGLLIGTLFGLVLQSAFEAWWVAPGSPEYIYFWAITGTTFGVANSVKHRAERRF